MCGGMEVHLHEFLTSIFYRTEWANFISGRFYPVKTVIYWVRGRRELQIRSGSYGEETNFVPCRESNLDFSDVHLTV